MVFKTLMEMPLTDFQPSARQEDLPALTLSKLDRPTYEQYRDLHNKVGEPYGWENRARINDIASLTTLLADDKVELWQFYNRSTLIGYALFTCDAQGAAEMEDFGFFPEYSGMGLGNFFLSEIIKRMAEIGVSKVWLTTRSTNHPKVISFYEKAGFKIVSQIPIENN
jgi:ribosomal protein S18 acetylase RimI-like enzyme